MSIEKLVHDVPFIVGAAKRQQQPAFPATDDNRPMFDEMHNMMKDLTCTATPSKVFPNIRKITITRSS